MENLRHEVKVHATIRFTAESASESCMSGKWRRIVVEEEAAYDEEFFPLKEPLAYQLDRNQLTVGRTAICDGYLLLSGKLEASRIDGTFDAVDMLGGQKLGFFTLTRVE